MKSISPSVTIVVPVFNAEEFLAATLDSLLNQTYPNLKIIAVNDGSSDGSVSILNQYNGRIEVIHQENAGQSAALNRGWQASQSEWIGYLSADDIIQKTCIEELVTAANENPSAIAIFPDYRLIDNSGQAYQTVVAPDFTGASVYGDFLCPPGPGAIFRRSAALVAGLWRSDLRQIPDFEFWLRLSLQGNILHLNRVLADFRVHESSTTFAVSNFLKAEEPTKVAHEFFGRGDLTSEIKNFRQRGLSSAHLLTSRLHLRAGRLFDGLRHLVMAVKIYPYCLLHFRTFRLLGNGLFGRSIHRLKILLNMSR